MWQKNKNLYIIITSFLFVIIFAYSTSLLKIEAPQVPKELLDKQKAETLSKEKYTIVGRSTVVPVNILNKEKVILLTIDDGPSSRTQEIINILKKHNAKAIFFVNGMHDRGHPQVIENTAKEGFAVGNHTWSHLNLKKEKDIQIIENEIIKNGELITIRTGTNPRFFRAPYGESNAFIRKLVKDKGMIFMDWSGSVVDWDKSTIEKDIFVKNVINDIHTGSIILIHEHPWSLANLDALLTSIESKGYTYVDPKNIIE